MDGEERLYFVVETKGSLFADDLRDNEAAKIACGEAHFKALAINQNPARYVKATRINDLMEHRRSEEHTSELQSLMRISYAVFCLKKKNNPQARTTITNKQHIRTHNEKIKTTEHK